MNREVMTVETKGSRAALFIVTVAFFAALALDIAVPALVLSLMATVNWLVLEGAPVRRWKGSMA